ncbi:acetyltransferase [Providencia heimbachae]|uniref:acetyltransferase n=1 Tax=Providencia TaxID=586 RepID=UPI0008391E63|nr:acetyltransferase [Providencia heimbachae]NIH23985.1 acetyltransferase [Providencia heimbachae]
MNKKPLVIIGGGGHASVLVDILLSQGREILAVISQHDISSRRIFSGFPHLTQDTDVKKFTPSEIILVNGIGIQANSDFRQKINSYFIEVGYEFETVIANSSIVSPYAEIKTGVQIFPSVIIQAGVTIEEHSIINTGAIIEHDCKIGSNNHIAPRAVLCGGVTTAKNVYIGANATVIQGISIEEKSIVGAGAILTQNLPSQSTCYPNRSLIKTNKLK